MQLYFPANYVEEVSNGAQVDTKAQVQIRAQIIVELKVKPMLILTVNKLLGHCVLQQEVEDNPLGELCKGIVEISKSNIQNCEFIMFIISLLIQHAVICIHTPLRHTFYLHTVKMFLLSLLTLFFIYILLK